MPMVVDLPAPLLERMLPVTLVAALVGFLARGWIARRPRAVLAS